MFILQCNQNYAAGKWSWMLNLGMQQENLSAAHTEVASSWIQTRDYFINTKLLFLTMQETNTKRGQYYFQNGLVALILSNLIWNTLFQAQLFSPQCWSILKYHLVQLKKVCVLYQKCPHTNNGSERTWKALFKSTCSLQQHRLSLC